MRRGAAVMESVMAVTILVMLSIAVVEFGTTAGIQNAIAHAAVKAAREAGKGADADALVTVVNNVLDPHELTIGNDAGLLLEDPAALLNENRGDVPCNAPAADVENGYVRVTVCVSGTALPFIRHLEALGICFTDRLFQFSSVTKRECSG
jgi:hypothetical protein